MKRPEMKYHENGMPYKTQHILDMNEYADSLEQENTKLKEEIERRRNEFNLLTEGQVKTLDKLGEVQSQNKQLIEALENVTNDLEEIEGFTNNVMKTKELLNQLTEK